MPVYTKHELYSFSLVAGFVVLSLEILAFRMLAPTFGNSVFVSGSIVTVILTFLSIGYFLGGNLADKNPQKSLLIFIFASSTLYLLTLLFLFRWILEFFGHFSTIAGSVFAALTLFAFPVTVLSLVSPLLIKFHSGTSGVGVSAGNIYATSTLGSILGSILTTFLFIPYLGVKNTLFTNAVLLAFCGIRIKKLPFAVLLGCSGLILPSLSYSQSPYLYFKESPYNTIFVVEINGVKYLRLNQNRGMHSSSLGPDYLTHLIPDDYLIGPKLLSSFKSLLILGGGGGTSAEQFTHFYKPEKIDMVEIDREVSGTSKILGLPLENVHRIHSDARRFLKENSFQYDLIEIDIFGGGIYIPFHVSTLEFFTEVSRSLRDGGLVMMNVVKTNEGFSNAIADTLAEVFPYVYSLNNRVLVAYKTQTPVVIPGLIRHISTRHILTDDRSNLEWLTYAFASQLQKSH